jgi:hypothetical protein
MEKLGRLEQGNVSEACAQLSLRAAELVAARRRGCEELVARFEAPLKEAVRLQLQRLWRLPAPPQHAHAWRYTW